MFEKRRTVSEVIDMLMRQDPKDEVEIDGQAMVVYSTGSIKQKIHDDMDEISRDLIEKLPFILKDLKEAKDKIEGFKNLTSKHRGETGFYLYSDLCSVCKNIDQIESELKVCGNEANRWLDPKYLIQTIKDEKEMSKKA